MTTESILNTDILIRDRACIQFFGSEILRKLIFRQYKFSSVGILLHYLDHIVGHLQCFFAKMTNARQTPGGGDGHPWNCLRHYHVSKKWPPYSDF